MFHILPLNEEYAQQTAHILAKSFMDEPMQTVLDTTYEDILEFMEHTVRHAIPAGLSVIAVDTATDQVVAANINKDLLEEPIGENDPFSDRLLPIFMLLDELDQFYHNHYEVQPGAIHHNLMMATDSSYRNQDLSNQFFKACTDIAREKGFKTMLTELTGPVSIHVATQKLGYEVVHELKYADFCYNDTYPFKAIQGADKCVLAHRPIPA